MSCKKGHQILKPRCRACSELKKEWYEKLASDGFKDIETGNQFYEARTIQMELERRKGFQTQTTYQSTVSYYQWARNKLEEGFFTSYRDKLIWENHAEGISRRKMSEKIGLEGSWITRKIHKIEDYLKSGSISSMSCQMALF